MKKIIILGMALVLSASPSLWGQPSLSLQVPNFSPSQHGFDYRNSFPWKEWIMMAPSDLPYMDFSTKNDGYGLCGGMSHVVHELFVFKEKIPSSTRRPNIYDPWYYYLANAQLETFGARGDKLEKIHEWFKMTDGKKNLPKLTFAELLGLKLQLKRKKLTQLVLMYRTQGEGGMWENHQVLAYGLEEEEGKGKIKIYDPNYPKEDKVVIEYQLEGKEVILTYEGSIDPNKRVYGFFITSPRLQSPRENLAYLATLGKDALLERLRQLDQSAEEIIISLKRYTTMKPAEIIRLLQKEGYQAYEIAQGLKKHYQQNAEAIAQLLVQAKFSPQEIVQALQKAFAKNGNEIARLLRSTNLSATQIAQGLVDAFNYTPDKVVNILKRLGVSIPEIGDVILTGLKINNGYQAIDILRKANYGALDIATILKTKYKSSYTTIAKALKDRCRFSAYDTGLAIYKAYRLSAASVASALYETAKYDLTDCKKVIQKIFNLTTADLANLF